MAEGTMVFVTVLPFPWPPPRQIIVFRQLHEESLVEPSAADHGKLNLTVTEISTGAVLSFISQPIAILGNRPRPVQAMVLWDARKCWLRLSRRDLLPDGESVPVLTLAALSVPTEKSFENINASNACKPWIINRQFKFTGKTARRNRRLKTIQEVTEDLRNSILRLTHLSTELRSGKQFLLGTLAGEIRASVYWPPARPSQQDDNWNPLLLYVASKADLPLPVYAVPHVPTSALIGQSELHLTVEIPRVDAIFPTDKIRDLQEVLMDTVLRLGPVPGKTIIALGLIKELAHTVGAAHYDVDASEFIDVMRTMTTAEGDQVTNFMCQTAETLVSLSEWVLSELTTRKLIP